jgi:hypothetical protein
MYAFNTFRNTKLNAFLQIGIEVIKAMNMNNTIYGDVMPCISVEIHRHSGGDAVSIFSVEEQTNKETSKEQD